MIKRILSAAILFASVAAFGQGACYPAGVVLLDTGRPANGASIRVCTAGSTGTPCTPAASLFTDPTLGTPLIGSPIVTADAHGNFGFCASAGNNYDLQISGTGITTLTIRNLPLPPTSPINAASLTSSSANPANVGLIKMASTDCLDWRNNANTGNIQLCKNTSDQLDMTAFAAVQMPGLFNVTTGSNAVSSQIDMGRAASEAEISIPASNGLFFTNSDLAGGDMTIRVDGSTHRIYLGTGTGIAPIAVTNTGENFYGSTSGSTAVQASATASGTLTLPAATDTLVARNTTDTLTKKTLTVAGSGNSVTLVNWQGPAAAIVGTGADANIYTFSIPATTMQAGKGIRITANWQHTTGTASVTYKLKFGATVVATNGTNESVFGTARYVILNNPGSTTAQTAWQESTVTATPVTYAPQFASPAENTGGAVTVSLTFNVAATDQVTPKGFLVELIQ